MHTSWPEFAAGISPPLKELRADAPDVMKRLSAMARAAMEAKALDTKAKELGTLVAVRCDACFAFHADAALRQGATRDEMLKTIGTAISMGADPAVMYAA